MKLFLIWALYGIWAVLVGGALLYATLLLHDHNSLRAWLARRKQMRTCGNCSHWDHAEGQAALQQNPVFVRVMSVVSPAEQSRPIAGYEKKPCHCFDEELQVAKPDCSVCKGTGQVDHPIRGKAALPMKASWAEMGACLKHENVCWAGDTCSQWERAARAPFISPAQLVRRAG